MNDQTLSTRLHELKMLREKELAGDKNEKYLEDLKLSIRTVENQLEYAKNTKFEVV